MGRVLINKQSIDNSSPAKQTSLENRQGKPIHRTNTSSGIRLLGKCSPPWVSTEATELLMRIGLYRGPLSLLYCSVLEPVGPPPTWPLINNYPRRLNAIMAGRGWMVGKMATKTLIILPVDPDEIDAVWAAFVSVSIKSNRPLDSWKRNDQENDIGIEIKKRVGGGWGALRVVLALSGLLLKRWPARLPALLMVGETVKNTQPINAVMKHASCVQRRRERRMDFRWLIFQWREARLNKSCASRFDVDLSDRASHRWYKAWGSFFREDRSFRSAWVVLWKGSRWFFFGGGFNKFRRYNNFLRAV